MPRYPLADLEAQVGMSNVTVRNLRVEGGKVEEFARAIHDDNPAFRATKRDEPVVAPLTFTRTSYFPQYRTPVADWEFGFELGFDRNRSVHGEQAFEFERPVREGDVLTGVTTLTDVYQREGGKGGTMTFAVFETEYRDADDELVVVSRNTRIETGQPVGDEEGPE
ncbi:FAS1-like dehydratase domain-containing protein [Halorarius litoreus]|uniref:FAS1-like dehydratase domain-containing protein n=1 Tax=Halorarius litoreus TaxID=2962676 RepID=UPI0020CE9061|nr:MaoC family dehydratase N-terminal domain-containing protein [Halorarius litoreus]